ncbi:MAG: UDP-N-acetylmuramate dehydrogenase [Gemmatimonadota bacterium]
MRWEADVRLGEHTRYRIGGPARGFGHAESREELAAGLGGLAGAPHRVLGRGANLLVADRGVEEHVIVLAGAFDRLRVGDARIEAGAGAGLPALVGEARRGGFRGWSFLEAVPGSVGGGLRMNAGSVETGLWDRVDSAEAMTPAGETVRLTPAEAEPSYRSVRVPESWIFLGARFRTERGETATIEAEHFERRRRKVETQVYDLPSCGSIWKNPGGEWAGAWQLVERVGMRGARRGGARITERHANFIANVEEATASDVWWLMAETRRRVREETGVELSPEIRLWGFEPEELAAVGATPVEEAEA